MNPLDKETWDKIESHFLDDRIKLIIKLLIQRINFFANFYKKLNLDELREVYAMFFYTNLLDLCTFADAFKIQQDLNEFNPFYVWYTFFNSFKHIDMAMQMVRCDFERNTFKIPFSDLTYQNRKQFNEVNNPIFIKLRKEFFDVLTPSMNKSFEIRIEKWLEIKDFLQFILDELPEKDILINKETDFYKNRFQLWRFYLTKTKNK